MSSMFVRVQKKQYGPFSSAELKNLVANGKFSAQDMVYHEDEDQWIKAENVDELKGLFTRPVVEQRQKKVYAIGGGKGGVGKTILTASIGIGLAALKREVVVVDADLGGALLLAGREPVFRLDGAGVLQPLSQFGGGHAQSGSQFGVASTTTLKPYSHQPEAILPPAYFLDSTELEQLKRHPR